MAAPSDWHALLDHSTRHGDVLYQSACASCHGADGRGSVALVHPSLYLIGSVGSANPATLVQVIAHGVDRIVGTRQAFMPPFRPSLNDAQIASLANFIRARFGAVLSDLSESQVAAILDGDDRAFSPWVIRDAGPIAIALIILLALVMLLVVWKVVRAIAIAASRR